MTTSFAADQTITPDAQDAARIRTILWCTGAAAALAGITIGVLARDALAGNGVQVLGSVRMAVALLVVAAIITGTARGMIVVLRREGDRRAERAIEAVAADTARQFDALPAAVVEPLQQVAAEFARLRGELRGTDPTTVEAVRWVPGAGNVYGRRTAEEDTVPIPKVDRAAAAYGTAMVHTQQTDLLAAIKQLDGQLQELTTSIPRWIEAARDRGRVEGRAEGYVEGVRDRLGRDRPDDD